MLRDFFNARVTNDNVMFTTPELLEAIFKQVASMDMRKQCNMRLEQVPGLERRGKSRVRRPTGGYRIVDNAWCFPWANLDTVGLAIDGVLQEVEALPYIANPAPAKAVRARDRIAPTLEALQEQLTRLEAKLDRLLAKTSV